MPPKTVQVDAPSRLHFGLFSFGGGARQFGGVGVMIEKPGLCLLATAAEQFAAVGPLADRVREFAELWIQFHQLPSLPACRLEIQKAPPQHVGLGTGTQLGLAVAGALNAFCELPPATAPELAVSVRRGLRSAVGTYGFVSGGMIVERGKSAQDFISPLDCHLELQWEWRFVLVRPLGLAGVSGGEESRAFSSLPEVSPEVSERLIAQVRDSLVPAAALGDFPKFSQTLYEFGRAAGLCFAEKQGGAYNGPLLTSLVETIRRLGIVGVGQSSWGPTIYALCQNQAAAENLAQQLPSQFATTELDITITPPNNAGARISVTR